MIYSVGIETSGLSSARCGILAICVACVTDSGAPGVYSAITHVQPKLTVEAGALRLMQNNGLLAAQAAAQATGQTKDLGEWVRSLPRDEFGSRDRLVLWQGEFAAEFLRAADLRFGDCSPAHYWSGLLLARAAGMTLPAKASMQREQPKALAGMQAALLCMQKGWNL